MIGGKGFVLPHISITNNKKDKPLWTYLVVCYSTISNNVVGVGKFNNSSLEEAE